MFMSFKIFKNAFIYSIDNYALFEHGVLVVMM